MTTADVGRVRIDLRLNLQVSPVRFDRQRMLTLGGFPPVFDHILIVLVVEKEMGE